MTVILKIHTNDAHSFVLHLDAHNLVQLLTGETQYHFLRGSPVQV